MKLLLFNPAPWCRSTREFSSEPRRCADGGWRLDASGGDAALVSGRRWSRRFGEFKGKGSTLSCNETGEYFESRDDVGVTTNDEEVQKIVSFQRRNFRQAGASASSSRTAVTRWGWGRARPQVTGATWIRPVRPGSALPPPRRQEGALLVLADSKSTKRDPRCCLCGEHFKDMAAPAAKWICCRLCGPLLWG